jgi:hypothetical protein
MDIEHFNCLSWFLDKRESHEQDGEKLPFATTSRIQTASSDPAMAIGAFQWRIRAMDPLL